MLLRLTRILYVQEFNFLIGKSKSSQNQSPQRTKSSRNKKRRSVCRPSLPPKAISVAFQALLQDRNLGSGHSRCVGRSNGRRSRSSPLQQSHRASEHAGASTESMERRKDSLGERRHDAVSRSRAVLSALQSAAEIRVPNHAAADLSAGFGRKEQGRLSRNRFRIACGVYVLLVLQTYPLSRDCLVCFIDTNERSSLCEGIRLLSLSLFAEGHRGSEGAVEDVGFATVIVVGLFISLVVVCPTNIRQNICSLFYNPLFDLIAKQK